MEFTKSLSDVLEYAQIRVSMLRLEFLTPEDVLHAIISKSKEFETLCHCYAIDCNTDLKKPLENANSDFVPHEYVYQLQISVQFVSMMTWAEEYAKKEERSEIDIPDVLCAILKLQESEASYLLHRYFTTDDAELSEDIRHAYKGEPIKFKPHDNGSRIDCDFDDDFDFGNPFSDSDSKTQWTDLVTCITDLLDSHHPIIGREQELDRTIQVLCRYTKNNPLHVGEPGVGKTALVYGLAQRIRDGHVPHSLSGAKIYQIEVGNLVAGTHYRGDFENRIKKIMEGASQLDNAIIYIDEIHTLIGSGSTGGDSLDGANMLKPYLEAGKIRFIGATTYKEYNKYFQQSQGMVRRFQKIDVPEPSEEETLEILKGIRKHYENHHNIQIDDDVLQYAIRMSVRHITGRCLPDKAIDLIDEAGAYCQLHPDAVDNSMILSREVINLTLKRICNMTDEMLSETDKGNESLAHLEEHIKNKIYGQDTAVQQLVETIQLAKAGLNEPDKPLASLLFIGPTGVGKTELCRVLSQELGIELVRFDMSEYTEKHTIAKLIGSPAGYVGYDDGGLLTDAIRKTPNCLLLLDEIEKAHSDIYNILLQVMDYAHLTDNRGNKADFKNVILVMTSNAGAQYASMASLGFGNNTSRGEGMLQAVKKTFKPEFINRLTGMIVFNDMDRHMASMIVDKKLAELSDRLAAKNVSLQLSSEAKKYLLDKGFTPKYGAREIDRVIRQNVTPLLIRSILFGTLKNGGTANIDIVDNALVLNT